MKLYGSTSVGEVIAVRPDVAATMVGLSPQTLARLAKQGRIRAIKLGTERNAPVLYLVESLQAFLRSAGKPCEITT